MSDLDPAPALIERGGTGGILAGPVLDLVPGRTASLGPGTDVRRLLPTMGRRMVGAWCFLDHYGPDEIGNGTGMQVPPHPHTGLQTVSWLLEGDIRHRDSLGSDVVLQPGDLGLMTSGQGIAHSEQSPVPHARFLHGTQLWVALPEGARQMAPQWEHHPAVPAFGWYGLDVRIVLGDFAGYRAPATTFSPLVGLDFTMPSAMRTTVPLEPDFEYAAIAVSGAPVIGGVPVPIGSLLYLGAGRREVTLEAPTRSRVMLLGGAPFQERIVMWWNLLGRSHDEIQAYRAQWEQQDPTGRFAEVPGWDGERTDAPPLPPARLIPRGRER
jgi:redox-sensitive bicupin YhaK (pirin superfamily)